VFSGFVEDVFALMYQTTRIIGVPADESDNSCRLSTISRSEVFNMLQ